MENKKEQKSYGTLKVKKPEGEVEINIINVLSGIIDSLNHKTSIAKTEENTYSIQVQTDNNFHHMHLTKRSIVVLHSLLGIYLLAENIDTNAIYNEITNIGLELSSSDNIDINSLLNKIKNSENG